MNRLKEYELIHDDEIRQITKQAIEKFPDYFWESPATSSDRYHHPKCRYERGLWIHTKMVCTAYLRMISSFTNRSVLTTHEADCGLAACILHDSWKGGKHGTADGSAVSNHDLIAAQFVRDETDLPELVASVIETHMGPWYDGPEPGETLEEVVHMADMSASTENTTHGVYKPHSKITDVYPDIKQAQFDRKGLYQ